MTKGYTEAKYIEQRLTEVDAKINSLFNMVHELNKRMDALETPFRVGK